MILLGRPLQKLSPAEAERRSKAREQAREALMHCRSGNLTPWAKLLYDLTINPVLQEAFCREMGYGIPPLNIGTTQHRVLDYWLEAQAITARGWIVEFREGDYQALPAFIEHVRKNGSAFLARLNLNAAELKFVRARLAAH